MIRSTPLALAVLALAASPAPASAHAHLLASTPAAGARQAAPPRSIILRFSEGLETPLCHVDLADAAGRAVALAPLTADDAKSLDITPKAPLTPGTYTVRWRVVSTDTHASQGRFDFTVAAP